MHSQKPDTSVKDSRHKARTGAQVLYLTTACAMLFFLGPLLASDNGLTRHPLLGGAVLAIIFTLCAAIFLLRRQHNAPSEHEDDAQAGSHPESHPPPLSPAEIRSSLGTVFRLSRDLAMTPLSKEQKRLADTIRASVDEILATMERAPAVDTPHGKNEQKSLAAPSPSSGEAERREKTEDSAYPRTLLLTADNTDRHRIQEHMSGWKKPLAICKNSAHAFSRLITAAQKNQPFELAFVDQRHLDMNAKQFAHSVRAESLLHNLTLVYVGLEQSADREKQLLNAGYSAVLYTPVDKTLLFNALHTPKTLSSEQPKVANLIDHYAREKATLPPLDILVAVSRADNRRLICRILERAGHQPYAVENGEQALDALDTHHFDLAIMEREMPVMSGIEAIKLFRFTHTQQEWMPFIVLAQKAGTEVIQECNQANVDACLTEPPRTALLLEAVREAVAKRDNCPAAPKSPDQGKGDAVNNPGPALIKGAALRELEELGSGREFVKNLINSFLEDSENLLLCMESAFQKQRHQCYIDLAHAFKDSAGNLGAIAIYKLSVRATRLNQDEFLKQGGSLVTEIRVAFNGTRSALMDYLVKQDNSISRR